MVSPSRLLPHPQNSQVQGLSPCRGVQGTRSPLPGGVGGRMPLRKGCGGRMPCGESGESVKSRVDVCDEGIEKLRLCVWNVVLHFSQTLKKTCFCDA